MDADEDWDFDNLDRPSKNINQQAASASAFSNYDNQQEHKTVRSAKQPNLDLFDQLEMQENTAIRASKQPKLDDFDQLLDEYALGGSLDIKMSTHELQ